MWGHSPKQILTPMANNMAINILACPGIIIDTSNGRERRRGPSRIKTDSLNVSFGLETSKCVHRSKVAIPTLTSI